MSGEREFFAQMVVDAVCHLDPERLDLRMLGVKKVQVGCWLAAWLPRWVLGQGAGSEESAGGVLAGWLAGWPGLVMVGWLLFYRVRAGAWWQQQQQQPAPRPHWLTLPPIPLGTVVQGGGLRDSFLVDGVAFKKTFSYAGFEMQPKQYEVSAGAGAGRIVLCCAPWGRRVGRVVGWGWAGVGGLRRCCCARAPASACNLARPRTQVRTHTTQVLSFSLCLTRSHTHTHIHNEGPQDPFAEHRAGAQGSALTPPPPPYPPLSPSHTLPYPPLLHTLLHTTPRCPLSPAHDTAEPQDPAAELHAGAQGSSEPPHCHPPTHNTLLPPLPMQNPKILLLNIELELKAEKENAEVRLEDPAQYQAIVDAGGYCRRVLLGAAGYH